MIRFFGHFEGDQQTYRGKGEVEDIRSNRDCIKAFVAKVIEAGVIQRAELDGIDKEAVGLVDEAVAHAKAAPLPQPKDLMTDVYVAY
jgi:pyruvate dehydrogenase E1 component alpha subunit